MERERVREKEPVQKDQGEHYENTLRLNGDARERDKTGKIVIKAKERPWHQHRQALTKTYLSWHGFSDTAAVDWTCFIHDVKKHSGKHRHQGGIPLVLIQIEMKVVLTDD